jgi:hypothetical protein
MFSTNYNYQYFDWSHDPIPGEPFKHIGNLITHIITPTITIGLSDYFNINYQQTIGVRSMDWMGQEDSNHHRDENTLSDFLDQAIGNAFGDASINLKYLITNTGMQPGTRIFLGTGLIIPSNNVLTESPFLENEDGSALNEHRHFSLSDGCYKTNFELQLYFKNNGKNIFIPSFYGLNLNYIKPLKESDYGYLSSNTYTVVGSSLFATKLKPIWAPKGISLGLIYLKTEEAFWNNQVAPNSKSEMKIPSIGLIWSHKDYGSFSLNAKYTNSANISESSINNEVSMFELSIGYRKTLNYTIPWLSDY